MAGVEGTGQSQAWRALQVEVEGARDFLNGVLMDEKEDRGGEKGVGKFRQEVREARRVEGERKRDGERERVKKEKERGKVERAKAKVDKRGQHHRFETEVLDPADPSWLEGDEVFSLDYALGQDAEILRRNRERDELREVGKLEARKAEEREKEKEKARKAGSQRTKKRHRPDSDTQPFAAGRTVVATPQSTALKDAEPFPLLEASQRHLDRRRMERELTADLSKTKARAATETAQAREEKSQRRKRSEADWYAEVLAEWDMQPAESMFQRHQNPTAHLQETANPPPKAKKRKSEPAVEEEGTRNGFLRLGRGLE